jgi:hypothetical protein
MGSFPVSCGAASGNSFFAEKKIQKILFLLRSPLRVCCVLCWCACVKLGLRVRLRVPNSGHAMFSTIFWFGWRVSVRGADSANFWRLFGVWSLWGENLKNAPRFDAVAALWPRARHREKSPTMNPQ